MKRRMAISTLGGVVVSGFTGCLGSGQSGEIEHMRTTNPETTRSPVYGPIAVRLIDFRFEVPPDDNASIEVNLTRTSIIRLSIEDGSGTGTVMIFSEPEYEKFKDGESGRGTVMTKPNGTSIAAEEAGEVTDTQQVLVASNVGREGTDTENVFEGQVTITERLRPIKQFNYPAVE